MNELIAQTITDEYPSKDIINEFDIAIRENSNISQSDYEYLASEISQYSTNQLQRMLEQSVSNPESFKSNIHSIIANTRKKKTADDEKRRKQREKDEQEKNELRLNNEKLIQEITNISNQLSDLQSSVAHEKQQRDKSKKCRKKIVLSTIVPAIAILVGVFLIRNFADITDLFNTILNWIIGASGLWGFIGLMITIVKYIKDK